MYREVLTWSQASLCRKPGRASPRKLWLLLHWGYTEATSWLYYMRLYYGCCYSCCVSQEGGRVMAAMPARRENVSAVPTAPRVSFQPFSSRFAHPGSASSVERVNRISNTSAQLFICVWLFVTPWTVACQASLSMEFSRPEHWNGPAIPFSRGSSLPRDRTQDSHIAGRFFTFWVTREAIVYVKSI